ncbi:MAG TPA: ABC transporter permease [Jatrophihabitantaceae bacterium]|nr:ABC transporter permease [Jatrophihabitantaceae bacterium]
MSATVVRQRGSTWTVVEYKILQARKYWRAVVIVGLVTPLFYLLALGVGLGVVVNRNSGGQLGVPYLVFVAPAFLTAAALQVATNEAAFPVMGGFRWERLFHGIAATPLRPLQIADGVLWWITIRVSLNSAVYLAILAAFGGAHRWQVVFAVPAAVLCGMAFGAPVAALSATLRNDGQAFNVVFRFIVTPMFLFSGTFYPISQLPGWAQALAHVSPLWHGTELARDAAIGGLSSFAVLGHLAFLVVWLVVGVSLARWRFRVRLEE